MKLMLKNKCREFAVKVIRRIFNKKNLFSSLKITGFLALYGVLFVITLYFTMFKLIKIDEIRVPNLIGSKLSEVIKSSQKNHFKIKKKIGYYQGNYEPLTVIDQFPESATTIKKNSFITIYITADVEKVTVPDLEGYSLLEIERILEDAKLRKRYISYVETDGIPANTIIDQSIPPGLEVEVRKGIDLLVSKGRSKVSFLMPDLIGKPLEAARRFLNEQGLKIAESRIQRVVYHGIQPDIIITQSPKPGYRISSNNLIDLWVSR
jgi:beta-lactam-binding protein with PASTA domain